MVIAVLEARCGIAFTGNDIYLNVAGGLRILEPAADLAVATALLSALTDQPPPPNSVIFGEIGLSGEIRTVGQTDHRLREAAKLGFNTSIIPKGINGDNSGHSISSTSIQRTEIMHLRNLVELINNSSARPGHPATPEYGYLK